MLPGADKLRRKSCRKLRFLLHPIYVSGYREWANMKASVINCVTVTSNLLPEQVSMGAGTSQNKIVAVNLVEKQPVRLNVAIAVSAPIAGQGMIIEAGRKRLAGNKQAQHVAQLRHVLAPTLGAAGVAAELPGMDRRPH
jgi:hypothetical protein